VLAVGATIARKANISDRTVRARVFMWRAMLG
jgi:hypothetical protein